MIRPAQKLRTLATAAVISLAAAACGSTGPVPRTTPPGGTPLTLTDSLSSALSEVCAQRLAQLDERLATTTVDRSVPRDRIVEAETLRDEAARRMLMWDYDLALELLDEALAILDGRR